jgi:hypothetical protein
MAGLFLSAVDYIKNKLFDVYAPAYYHPYMPEELLNPKPTPIEKTNPWRMVSKSRRCPLPFYTPIDPNMMQKASYSIEIMLEMHAKKIPFELAVEDDIVEIFMNLDRYLLSLQADVEVGEPNIVAYAQLVISWRKEVYKHFYRYMKLHPAALEQFYPGGDKKKTLGYLMSITSGTKNVEEDLDPLLALSKPPYDISQTKTGQTSVNAGIDLEGSFGLAGGDISQDDGRDINFDDFLKR